MVNNDSVCKLYLLQEAIRISNSLSVLYLRFNVYRCEMRVVKETECPFYRTLCFFLFRGFLPSVGEGLLFYLFTLLLSYPCLGRIF